MKRAKKILFIVLITILTLFVFAGIGFVYVIYYPFSPKSDAKEVDIFVKWGASFGGVAQDLHNKGVVRSVDQLKFTAELFDKTQSLRVGKFTLKQGMSNYDALEALIKGPQSYIKVTLPEGYDSRRYADIVETQLDIDSTQFMALVEDSAFIKQFNVAAPSLEGYLYPETYQFTYGIRAQQVIATFVNHFFKIVPDTLIRDIRAKNMTLNEVLTLASIIEGEAMVDEEMPLISSVYHNRLEIGMRLQADPTIQYIIPDGPRRLLRRDLKIESPYNTYLNAGLPPGPISNPGIRALQAAVYPADTDYLYFVATGDGTHSFSRNYDQHLQAKRRFDEIRRQVEREKQQKASNAENE